MPNEISFITVISFNYDKVIVFFCNHIVILISHVHNFPVTVSTRIRVQRQLSHMRF